MARSVHISTARQMLNSGDTVDISIWKSDGSTMHRHNVISLHYGYYGRWCNVKLLTSGKMHRIRDICIFQINFQINGLEVFL